MQTPATLNPLARPPWAQEASGSNPDTPTKSFSTRNLQKPNLGTAALWCNLGTIKNITLKNRIGNLRE